MRNPTAKVPKEISDIAIMQKMHWDYWQLQACPAEIITYIAIKSQEEEIYRKEEENRQK